MTGTSLDGLDLALLDPDTLECRGWAVHSFPCELRQALRSLARSDTISLQALGTTETRYSYWMAQRVRLQLHEWQVQPGELMAVACHGQTLHHAPTGEAPFTFQLINPGLMAAELELPVVADFRRTDVALGGQGAPLVPPFHQALFGEAG
ncbi:MAG: anhydro-N-acetylmuramic acid kinase, partial [Gammaproteobacteria bacterium]